MRLIILVFVLSACGTDPELCRVPDGHTGTDYVQGVWYAPCDYGDQ